MKKHLTFFSLIFSFAIICLVYFLKIFSLKYYPVIMNSIIFGTFFISSFSKETIIQKFAKKIEGELTPAIKIYTRNLTYIWATITFIILLLSYISLFTNIKLWALYNGCISYCIIGLTFAIEYPIRVWYKKRYDT